MTRNSQVLDGLRAGKTSCRNVEIISYLRVVHLKIFGELKLRSTYQLHITRAFDNQLNGYGIVGTNFFRVDRRRDAELSYTTREVSRLRRKRLNIDSKLRSNNLLLHLNDSTTVEESVERIVRLSALCHNRIERNSRDLQLTSLLREQDVLTPYGSVVVASLIML